MSIKGEWSLVSTVAVFLGRIGVCSATVGSGLEGADEGACVAVGGILGGCCPIVESILGGCCPCAVASEKWREKTENRVLQ